MAWNFLVIFAVVLNILCSIVLILLNKHLVVAFQFKFMTVLSGLHFATAFIVCITFIMLGLQKYKPVNSYWSVFRISLVSFHLVGLKLFSSRIIFIMDAFFT